MNTTTSEVSPQANEQQTTFLEMLLDRCHNSLTSMGKMSIQTQQFVIVYETESVAQNAGLILCFNQIFGSAEFKPKRSGGYKFKEFIPVLGCSRSFEMLVFNRFLR